MTPVRRVCALLLVGVVLLAGCKVDANVDVRLNADGTGVVSTKVTLDAEAVARLTARAPLDQAVPLDDVRTAGWTVSKWSVANDGSATITVTHPFTGEADLAARLEDLVGSTGVLRDAAISHSRGFFGAKDTIKVTVDLRHLSTGIQSDSDVATALSNAGLDVNALDAQLTGELAHSLTVIVTVHAPDGQTANVFVEPGHVDTAQASASQTYTSRVVLLVVGVVLLVLAVVLTAASLATKKRRRRAS